MPLKDTSVVGPRDCGAVTKLNITPNDVLSGRGGFVNNHEGNVKFRELVLELVPVYCAETTKKLDKAKIAARIVDEVRGMDPPGRFLKEDPATSLWFEIGDERAGKKVGQAFRDLGPNGQLSGKNSIDQESSDEDAKLSAPPNIVEAGHTPPVSPQYDSKDTRACESRAQSKTSGQDNGRQLQELSRYPAFAVSTKTKAAEFDREIQRIIFPPVKRVVTNDKNELRKALDMMCERARHWEDQYYREREYSRRLEDRIVHLLSENQPSRKKRKTACEHSFAE